MRRRTSAREPTLDSNVLGAGSRYRDNLPRHLIGISRDLQTRVMTALRDNHGHHGLRPSFGSFLSAIRDGGRPISTISGQLAISKQAGSQIASLIEQAGYLERATNPLDRRSKLVTLTRKGRSLAEQAGHLIVQSETEYATLVGARAYGRFTMSLAKLYRGLGLPSQVPPSEVGRPMRSAGVLPLIVQSLQRTLMQATIARGHPGLKMSHGQVLTLIGPNGGRIHEIARIQHVSRQAISSISLELESLGYLRRASDPLDRRGVVLTLTRRGESLIEISVDAIGELESSFNTIIGDKKLVHMQSVAHDLYHALHLEEKIFEAGWLPNSATRLTGHRNSERGKNEIEQLAASLRRRLGTVDAALLAELLETRVRRTAT